MTLNSIIFPDSLPSIDLHGFDRDTSRVYINDFIQENKKLKNEFITIIHGNGSGILKNTTKETLVKNKNVIDYKSYYYNRGMTVVQIKL